MKFLVNVFPIIMGILVVIFNSIKHETLIVSLPIFMLSICIYGKNLLILQGLIFLLWILILLRNIKITGFVNYFDSRLKLGKNFKFFAFILFLTFSFLLFFELSDSSKTVFENLIKAIVGSIVILVFSFQVIYYIITPLFVVKREERNSRLKDYYKKNLRHEGGNYLVFEEDANRYRVDMLTFEGLRRKIGVKVTYTSYTFIFGVKAIGNLTYNQMDRGEHSKWEKNFEEERIGKKLIISIVFLICLILILGLIIVKIKH